MFLSHKPILINICVYLDYQNILNLFKTHKNIYQKLTEIVKFLISKNHFTDKELILSKKFINYIKSPNYYLPAIFAICDLKTAKNFSKKYLFNIRRAAHKCLKYENIKNFKYLLYKYNIEELIICLASKCYSYKSVLFLKSFNPNIEIYTGHFIKKYGFEEYYNLYENISEEITDKYCIKYWNPNLTQYLSFDIEKLIMDAFKYNQYELTIYLLKGLRDNKPEIYLPNRIDKNIVRLSYIFQNKEKIIEIIESGGFIKKKIYDFYKPDSKKAKKNLYEEAILTNQIEYIKENKILLKHIFRGITNPEVIKILLEKAETEKDLFKIYKASKIMHVEILEKYLEKNIYIGDLIIDNIWFVDIIPIIKKFSEYLDLNAIYRKSGIKVRKFLTEKFGIYKEDTDTENLYDFELIQKKFGYKPEIYDDIISFM